MKFGYQATFLNGRAETEVHNTFSGCVSFAFRLSTHFYVWCIMGDRRVRVAEVNLRGLQ